MLLHGGEEFQSSGTGEGTMIKELAVMTVAVVAGASWAAARGPEVSERISAVDTLGGGSGSTTTALAQAAARRSGESRYERGYAGETAVPAAAKQPAAATQPSPSYPHNDSRQYPYDGPHR